MNNVSDKICIESQNTHSVFNNFFFFFENRAVNEIMRKDIVELVRLQMTTVHVHCVLDTLDYKHTLRICNTHYFSTETVVARMCLCVTLYVHYLSC